MLGEVIKAVEYVGLGCIFLGLIIIDGRALGRVRQDLILKNAQGAVESTNKRPH